MRQRLGDVFFLVDIFRISFVAHTPLHQSSGGLTVSPYTSVYWVIGIRYGNRVRDGRSPNQS